MFTLFVNGIPVLKLSGVSEFPARQGEESWLVMDEEGNTIASYQPRTTRSSHRHVVEPTQNHVGVIPV
jgi:hypothetical protein